MESTANETNSNNIKEEVPLDDTKKKLDDTYAALRNHRIRFEDAIDPNSERVDKLRKTDILFGRGKGFQNHPGNKRMREIIDKYKNQYHSLKRSEKREMVENVYKEITLNGARFLKKLSDENAFVMVDEPVALQKVSHTLRCRKGTEKDYAEMQAASARALAGLDYSGRPAAETGVGAFSNTSLNLLSASNAGLGPEAQYLAALQRYQALVPGSLGIPSNDYYSTMLESARREQLLRDTLLLQQAGGLNPYSMKHGLWFPFGGRGLLWDFL